MPEYLVVLEQRVFAAAQCAVSRRPSPVGPSLFVCTLFSACSCKYSVEYLFVEDQVLLALDVLLPEVAKVLEVLEQGEVL